MPKRHFHASVAATVLEGKRQDCHTMALTLKEIVMQQIWHPAIHKENKRQFKWEFPVRRSTACNGWHKRAIL